MIFLYERMLIVRLLPYLRELRADGGTSCTGTMGRSVLGTKSFRMQLVIQKVDSKYNSPIREKDGTYKRVRAKYPEQRQIWTVTTLQRLCSSL